MFSVQYCKDTGIISATVSSDVPDESLPDGVAQIKIDNGEDIQGKKVDLESLQLVDSE